MDPGRIPTSHVAGGDNSRRSYARGRGFIADPVLEEQVEEVEVLYAYALIVYQTDRQTQCVVTMIIIERSACTPPGLGIHVHSCDRCAVTVGTRFMSRGRARWRRRAWYRHVHTCVGGATMSIN